MTTFKPLTNLVEAAVLNRTASFGLHPASLKSGRGRWSILSEFSYASLGFSDLGWIASAHGWKSSGWRSRRTVWQQG